MTRVRPDQVNSNDWFFFSFLIEINLVKNNHMVDVRVNPVTYGLTWWPNDYAINSVVEAFKL
jgi:hypothetical protein